MLRRVLTHAASGVDEAVRRALLGRSRSARARSRAESLGHAERLVALEAIRALYDRPEHYVHGSPFFARPDAPDAALHPVRRMAARGGDVEVEENHLAHARLFLGPGSGRPAAILLHGYRCGQFALEERVWPVRWLLERGVDVALAVLPFHAARAPARRGPLFPSSDPRFTNEGFRQAVLDVRALAALLGARGASAVGLLGMSLGGYTTALAATVADELAFAVPIIPLASIADAALQGGRLVGSPEEQRLQHQALDAAHRAVSPMARASRLSADRVLVIAAEGDRITPVAHARKLAEHFGAPLETVSGSHIVQLGRGDAFRAAGRLLGRLGLLAPR